MPTVLCRASPVQAASIAEYLHQAGIAARVSHHAGEAITGAGEVAMVLVEERQAEEARRLLREMDGQPAEMQQSLEEAARPDLSWLDERFRPPCPGCRGLLPLDGEVTACPACGAEVDVAEQVALTYGADVLSECYEETAEPIAERVLVAAKLSCPACGYWLEGLPARGECPECGGAYSKSDLVRGRSEEIPLPDAPEAQQPAERNIDMSNPIVCPRCETDLNYVGTKKFHEGTRAVSFLLGDLGELFTNREHFDVYVCPRCGRVELFVDGIGEEFRPR